MEAPLGPPTRKRKDRDPTGPSEPTGDNTNGNSASNNKLLAGYLAHEFLTCGTVLGERVGPGPGSGSGPGRAGCYEEVVHLVKEGGARISGVVNPTQLAAWLRR